MEIDYVYKTYSQSHQVFIYNNKIFFFFVLSFVFVWHASGPLVLSHNTHNIIKHI